MLVVIIGFWEVKMENYRKLVYVACGSAAASANLVRSRLAEYLKKDRINTEIVVMRIAEVPQSVKERKPDLIVITAGSISSLKKRVPEDVPIISGIPVMTSIGMPAFIKEVENILKRK